MSYGTCNACGSDDCEGYDACTIRSLRAEVERLRLVLEEATQCGCETCHAQARAALAGSPVETRLPVDDEAEARFEKLLAKRREKAESWLNQGPEVSGTLAFHAEPVETRRALAERVREACATEAGAAVRSNSESAVVVAAVRALDLDALLEEP